MDKIKISKDFSPTPGPRYIKEGIHSGELFRETIFYPLLKDAIEKGKKLIVDLDGTAGFGTSFLEESFGGLIREKGMKLSQISEHLELISLEEEYLIDDIKHYLQDAEAKGAK